MRKLRFFTLVAFLGPLALFAQSTGPQPTEADLMQQNPDLQVFLQQINQAEQAYSQGQFAQAATAAENAVATAEKLHNLSYSALALFHWGKALVQQGGSKRNKGIEVLERSVQMAIVKKNSALAMNGLELLRSQALARGKEKEVARLEKKMAEVSGQPVAPAAAPAPEAPSGRKDEIARINAELSQLAEELATQSQRSDQSAQMAAQLNRERQQLVALIGNQKMAIDNMSEKQAKDQLMIARQGKILDSMRYEKELTSMQLANKEVELQRKNAEIRFQSSQRNFFLSLAALGLMVALALYSRYRSIKTHNLVLEEKNRIIQEERQRSENLLLNILPGSIAEELKKQGHANTRTYERATVLFSDFKDFTQISEKMTPEELVKELDLCFKGFDQIITRYGLEKIKTIGDSYMCAGGLPDPSPSHPIKVVQAAMEMQQFLEALKAERMRQNRPFFEARVGIHTGPLVAGVVGDIKFAYDIWGDTVNVAARMETNSEPGKINISASTYELVKDQFPCTYRGKIAAKNKGEIDMYFVQN